MNNNHSKSSTAKKVIVSVIALIAVIGGIFGARAYVSSGKTAGVIQVINLADTWVENASSGYGQITQGGTQMVFLDTSMLVYKIYVSPGDHVAKGDPLIQYDATQAKLAADNYRIHYEMAKRDLKEARERLEYLKTFRPYVEPTPVYKTYKTPIRVLLTEDGLATQAFEADSIKGDGTKENPFVIDVNLNTEISKEMIAYLLNYDEEAILPNTVPKVKPEPDSATDGGETTEPTDPSQDVNPPGGEGGDTDPSGEEEEEIEYEESTVVPQKYFEFHIWESYQGMDSVQIATVGSKEDEDGIHRHAWMQEMFENPARGFFTFDSLIKMMPTAEIVFNDSDKDLLEHAMKLFTITKRGDAYPDPVEIPEQNMYSQEEINEMILNQTQLIRSQELAVSQAELDYRKAKQTATDGIVRAAQDGTVTEVGDPYAPQGDKALIQVKGGDGYEITSTISELQLGSIKVGDEITITMWSNGMTYTGKIKEISPYPTNNNMSYEGQAGNVSYYPYTAVLIDCEDELQPWDGGEIRFMSDSSNSKALFLLQSSFIREENGRSYVLKANEEGRLEKQYIEVGRILYGGYMVEIYGGLSLEDYIAFPYGKNGVEGAKADYESGVMGW